MTFWAPDLEQLDELLDQATAVVSMQEVHAGVRDRRVIGLRHDVDNTIAEAVWFARWEHDRGYRSTYYILHGAPYWHDKPLLRKSLRQIANLGHEIGIHNNALAEAHRTGRDPHLILVEAIVELQGYGYEVSGTVAHGDPDCYGPDGRVRFVNDMLFEECVRSGYDPIPFPVVPLASLDLDYDANWLGRGAYLSDSGDRWSPPGLQTVSARFPLVGQLHVLVHPCWWGSALEQGVAA